MTIEPNFEEIPLNPLAGSQTDPQPNTPATPAATSNIVPAPGGSVLSGGSIYSPNYSVGVAGWKIDAAGNIEANDGNFRGDITGASGTFTGTVTVGSINIGGDDATSAHIDTDGNLWLGASVANKATAPFRVSNAGVVVATNITATGTINATGGYLGAPTTVLNVSTSGLDIGVTGHIQGGASDYLTGTGFFLGYSGAAYKFSVGNPAGNYIGWDGTTLTIIGNQVIVNEYTSGANTWTKPTGAKSVVVQAWGGGGGGGNSGTNGASGGGGGGTYNTYTFNASDLSATVTVTVPSAAAAGAGGGTTTFGSYLSAYGGGAGANAGTDQESGGGGGGGLSSSGANSGAGAGDGGSGGAGGNPVGSAQGVGNSGFGGGGGGIKRSAPTPGSAAYGGGGGGAGNLLNGGAPAGVGGSSVYGGGGGGGGGETFGAGGASLFGGAGGTGGNGAGTNGTAPGGGGGGARGSASGGSGAVGRIVVTSYL